MNPSLPSLLASIIVPLEQHNVLEITYTDVIEYFVLSRPPLSSVAKGALLRKNRFKGVCITQVFLDEGNHLICKPNGVPYGRQILAKKIDRELLDAFSSTDLIIVL